MDSPQALRGVSRELLQDRAFLKRLLASSVWDEAFSLVPTDLLNDRSFVLDVVASAPNLLGKLPERYRDDRDIALAALQADWRALRYVSENLRAEPEFESWKRMF